MKTLKTIVLYLIILTVTSSSKCKDKIGHGDDRLTIVNNSNIMISSFLQYNYPDTSIQDKDTPGFNAIAVAPHSQNIHLTFVKWEVLIPQNNNQNTLMIFIYSSDTIKNKSWEEIQSGYNVLKRYDLSLADLENRNYTITYP